MPITESDIGIYTTQLKAALGNVGRLHEEADEREARLAASVEAERDNIFALRRRAAELTYSVVERVDRKVLNDAIVAYVAASPTPVSRAMIYRQFQLTCSPQSLSERLKRLRAQGRIDLLGKKRGARYV